MSNIRKNNKWYFEAKGHTGVHAQGKPIVHLTEFTTAKLRDIRVLDALLYEEEAAVFGDRAQPSPVIRATPEK